MSDGPAEKTTPRRWLAILLVVLPLWLALSAGAAIWHYFRQQEKRELAQRETFSRLVSADSLRDDLEKFVQTIGERNTASESAAANLSRTVAMIDGSLGPSNTGLAVRRIQGPAAWPILQVSLPAKEASSPALWVVTPYDSRPGSPGAEANASGLAATLAAVQALASSTPGRPIHFAFIPHANDPESPVIDTLARFTQIAPQPHAILVVEAMGASADLWLSSRDSSAPPLTLANGLGSIRGAEVVCLGDDVDLASLLFESGLPAVRVATRPMVAADDPDNRLPDPATLAAATGRLVELIRRCAANP